MYFIVHAAFVRIKLMMMMISWYLTESYRVGNQRGDIGIICPRGTSLFTYGGQVQKFKN